MVRLHSKQLWRISGQKWKARSNSQWMEWKRSSNRKVLRRRLRCRWWSHLDIRVRWMQIPRLSKMRSWNACQAGWVGKKRIPQVAFLYNNHETRRMWMADETEIPDVPTNHQPNFVQKQGNSFRLPITDYPLPISYPRSTIYPLHTVPIYPLPTSYPLPITHDLPVTHDPLVTHHRLPTTHFLPRINTLPITDYLLFSFYPRLKLYPSPTTHYPSFSHCSLPTPAIQSIPITEYPRLLTTHHRLPTAQLFTLDYPRSNIYPRLQTIHYLPMFSGLPGTDAETVEGKKALRLHGRRYCCYRGRW